MTEQQKDTIRNTAAFLATLAQGWGKTPPHKEQLKAYAQLLYSLLEEEGDSAELVITADTPKWKPFISGKERPDV